MWQNVLAKFINLHVSSEFRFNISCLLGQQVVNKDDNFTFRNITMVN